MENIFVEFLPPWVETGIQPAFYDKESGTVLQQTARMYARVNMLIRMFNRLSRNTKEEIERFERVTNEEIERFEKAVNDDMTEYKEHIDGVVADYIERFDTLYNYVHDYFDNLDVQEEIDHKLDELLDQGVLQEIIVSYVQTNVTWTFDTVADMKLATNLIDGSFARTLGFHTINDGGGALYHITNSGTANEMDVIAIDNLYANLIGGTDVKQFGAYGDGTHNDSNSIQQALDVLNYIELKDGTFLVSQVTITSSGKKVIGKNATLKSIDSNSSDSILLISGQGVESVTIDGLNIDGNKANNLGTVHGAKLTRTVYADCFGLLQNMEIKNCSGNGIYIYGANNALIREMKFNNIHSHHNDGNGMYSGTMTDSFIHECVFNDNKLNGIYISGSGSIKISQVKCYWNGIESTEELDVDRLPDSGMIVTSDVTPQPGKTYYTRSGSGVWQDSYKFTKFTGGSFDGGTDYYEISSSNYKARSSGIEIVGSSIILITNSEMQANAGDGIRVLSSYSINIDNTSLDNNGYYFDSDGTVHSYSSLGIEPFYCGFYAKSTDYLSVNAVTLNAFYNIAGISQAYGVSFDSCKKNQANIQSRLQTAPMKLLNINPEDIYLTVNGVLYPIDLDINYNITDLPEGYSLDASSTMKLVGNKVCFQIYIKNDTGIEANRDFNICNLNTHLRPQYRQIIKSAFLSQYYTNYHNGDVALAVIVESTGAITFRGITASMKYLNLTDEIVLIQR